MNIYYSKTTRGFYNSDIHGTKIPDDSVEITEILYKHLLDGQAEGKIIEANDQGFPDLVDVPELSEADLNAAHNATIISQIKSIEQDLQPRAMRDVIISNDNTRLVALDKQIADLRSQLK